jgi:ethanolamine ammonia-lyase small subunit
MDSGRDLLLQLGSHGAQRHSHRHTSKNQQIWTRKRTAARVSFSHSGTRGDSLRDTDPLLRHPTASDSNWAGDYVNWTLDTSLGSLS